MMTRKFNQLLVSLGVTITLLANAYPQSRTVMVQSNTGTLLFPTNLWSANASSARTGLGLGTAATNETSAFQASSAVLSNLASSNAVNLTNIRATNIVGVLSSSNIPPITLTNIGGTLAVVGGGTGATNAAGARTNIGLPLAALTNVTESAFRSAIGLPLAALTNTNEATFRTAIGLGTLDTASIQGVTAQTVTVTAGGGIVLQAALTNAGPFRTNIGISLPATLLTNTTVSGIRTELALNWSALTNSNASTALLGYITNGVVSYGLSGTTPLIFSNSVGNDTRIRLISNIDNSVMNLSVNTISFNAPGFGTNFIQLDEQKFAGTGVWTFHNAVAFNNTTNSAISRTNLGLPFTALTNTNASTFRSAIELPLAALTNTNVANFQGAIFAATNAAPTNTTNVNSWVDIQVGTNSFKVPLYK
jgi:hypothetical protein